MQPAGYETGPWLFARVREGTCRFISQKVLTQSFCKNQFPHKSVNLLSIVIDVQNKLTDLYGN